MSFRSALAEIADAATEEFGEDVILIPTLRRPNERPSEDPARPPYQVCGIFDKSAGGVHPAETELQVHHRGRHRATVVTVRPTVTVHDCDLKWPIVQGDEVIIVADAERYRVLHPERAMQGMTRLHLEQLGRPDTA